MDRLINDLKLIGINVKERQIFPHTRWFITLELMMFGHPIDQGPFRAVSYSRRLALYKACSKLPYSIRQKLKRLNADEFSKEDFAE